MLQVFRERKQTEKMNFVVTGVMNGMASGERRGDVRSKNLKAWILDTHNTQSNVF